MGNILVGQSGGPTSVINRSLAGVISEGKKQGKKVYGMVNGVRGFLDRSYIDLSDYIKDDFDLRILSQTPASFLGSSRYKFPSEKQDIGRYIEVFNLFEDLDIEYFIYIGGNDSMDTVMKLSNYGNKIGSKIRFIGIPKTIDNDLVMTDHTPGFGSAAKYIASVFKETRRDIEVYNAPSVTIVEVMGRNSGWLTASSALSEGKNSKGPDLIYLAENPFDEYDFIVKAEKLISKEKTILVAVSEGIRLQDGRYVSELTDAILHEDTFGHKQLSGTGNYLANLVYKNLRVKTRSIELNTVQRSSAHLLSRTDQEEAFYQGKLGVKSALEGESGKMVSINRMNNTPYEVRYKTVDVNEVANKEKLMPEEFIDLKNGYVTQEYLEYCRPLIEGEVDIFFEDGLPKHIVKNNKVR